MKTFNKIIGIDASRSLNQSPTGVERYSTEIIKALIKQIQQANKTNNSHISLKLYTPKFIKNLGEKYQKVIKFFRLWTVIRLSFEMLFFKPHILFVPAHVMPFFAPKNTITTVHDIAFLKFSNAYSKFQLFYLKWSTKNALKNAKKIIVPSASVKDDLIKYYKKKFPKVASKIHVIHHGKLGIKKIGKKTESMALQKLKINKCKYLLFIGRIEEKKNLEVLISAFEKINKKHEKIKLILGGKPGHGYEKIKQKIEASVCNQNIVETGYLQEFEISALLKNAQALILPSLDEGFGFPVLQGFETSCPVICSQIPALQEIGGECALFFEKNNANALAKNILKILNNKVLAKKMRACGEKRLENYNWDLSAKELFELMQKIS